MFRKLVPALFFVLSCSANYAQILPSFGGSRTATAGMQFLKLGPDARSNALGGSVIGEVEGPSAAYWNPAGLISSDSNKLNIQLGHSTYLANTSISHTSITWQPAAYRSIGVSIMSLYSQQMKVTTEFMPQGTGQTFGVNDLVVGLHYAQELTDNFQFGATLKYAQESFAGVASRSGLVDLGFQYNVGVRDLKFGVTISNFGFNAKPDGTLRFTGFNGEKELEEFQEIAVPATFQLGFSGLVYEKAQHNVRANIQLNHPTDNKETVAFGTEYGYKDLLNVRAGYVFGEQGRYPSMGFGLLIKSVFKGTQLDYTWVGRNMLGSVHYVTFGFKLH